MVRFLHTADVQLLGGRPSDDTATARLRQARFDTLRRIVELASEREVDFIVICGDLFEDNLVSNEAVHEALRVLRDAEPTPVFVLPGNHDACCSGSVYQRPAFAADAPGNVRVLATADPVSPADECVVYPCPVTQKTSLQDPTDAIPPREREGVIRIGLAHGAMMIPEHYREEDHPIPLDAPVRRQLDYLAVGHNHSLSIADSNRWAYPGTPEQTAFDEREPGHVLIVTIAGPGAVPEIDSVKVGQLTWLEWSQTVTEALDDDLAELRGRIERLPAREDTLLRLHLTGATRADRLPLIDDLDDWLQHAGLLRAELHSDVRTTEALEGALRGLAESDPVVAGTIADLQWLASLHAEAGARAAGELPPRPPDELLAVWQRVEQEHEDLDEQGLKPPLAEVADAALAALAEVASEVQS
jgi:DNA repair exonuclease SbcCD nuclease subunit